MARYSLAILLAAGCSGEGGGGKDGEEELEPAAEWACLHIAEGEVLDAAADQESAPEVETDYHPYRINLVPDEAGFLTFESSGGTATILGDYGFGVLARVSADGSALDIGSDFEANPNCPDDIPEMWTFDVDEGTHLIEIGPAFTANVWLMVAVE